MTVKPRSRIFAGALFAVAAVTDPLLAYAANDYAVAYAGAPEDFESKFRIISELERNDRAYPTLAALRRAAKRDAEKFSEALQSAGYYAAQVDYRLTASGDDAPPEVKFEIDQGALFRVTQYEIIYEDEAEGRPDDIDAAEIGATDSATGADLKKLHLKFLNHLWENGFPAAEIVARRASADFDEGTATAIFVFKSGPRAKFGELRVEGLSKTDEDFVRKLITWETGDDFERSKMVAYRDKLAATGLFSSVNIAPGAVAESGDAPIVVNLNERKRRTIGAGLSFSTAEGPGGRVFFENRNFLRHGETLRIELAGSEIEQSVNFNFSRPAPALPGEIFGNFEFLNETTEAFDARTITMAGGVAKRWLAERLETRGGLALETSKVDDGLSETRTYFVSAPFSATWNTENDLLNPTKGLRIALNVTPFTGTDTFVRAKLSGRSRIQFGAEDQFTLAGRAALGATLASGLFDLPSNKRFFSGGGGSVRGFGFQEAGPVQIITPAGGGASEVRPLGGRSLIEGAVEARAMVTEKIQIAAFADAGSVSSSALPDFDERIFVGVGAGVRYFTPIGPIRADVAFPLDKRATDQSFQIFIAIGQPF